MYLLKIKALFAKKILRAALRSLLGKWSDEVSYVLLLSAPCFLAVAGWLASCKSKLRHKNKASMNVEHFIMSNVLASERKKERTKEPVVGQWLWLS